MCKFPLQRKSCNEMSYYQELRTINMINMKNKYEMHWDDKNIKFSYFEMSQYIKFCCIYKVKLRYLFKKRKIANFREKCTFILKSNY